MRDAFLNRPYDHIGASRTSFDRVRDGYAGTYHKRPTSGAEKAMHWIAVLLLLAAVGLLLAGCGQ